MSFVSTDPEGRIGDIYTPARHEPTVAEAALCAEIKEFCYNVDEARSRLLRVWEIITSYVRGDQHLYRNGTGELVKVRRKNKRLESTNNQLKLAERQLHAKLTKYIPEFEAEPANGDQDEMEGALAASSFLQYFRHKEDFDIKFLLSLHDVARYGIGMHILQWNPRGGKRLAVCPVCGYSESDDIHVGEECPACQYEYAYETQEYEQAQINQQELAMRGVVPAPLPPPPEPNIGILEPLFEGDLEICHVHPKEFYPELGVTDIKYMGTWATRRVRPVPDARADWFMYADVIDKKPGIYQFNNIKQAQYSSAGHFQYDDYKNHCVETRRYTKPTDAYSKGRLVVTINDEICVYDGPNPLWMIQRPNVFVYPWDKDTETFWSQPFAEHAWHRQKELNENERQQRENSELLSNGKLVVYRNSGVRPDEVQATTGQVLSVIPGMPAPQYLRGPELPASAWNRGGLVKGSIYEQASIGQAEQGIMSGDVSGRALAIIQAESDQQLGPTYQYIWSEVSEMFRSAVIAARYYYSTDKQFHINGDMGLQVFTLADLELWSGRDLRIVPEDGLSKNQQLRIQSVSQLATLGLFSNPQTGMMDIPRFVKAAKIRIAGIGGDKNQAQRSHAHWMLRQFQQYDFSPMPKAWDDPIIHAEVLAHWLETKGYNPKMDLQIIAHVQNVFGFYMEMAQFLANPGGQQPSLSSVSGPSVGGMGAGGQNAQPSAPVLQQAANTVAQADQQAEGQARAIGLPREGA